MLPIGPESTIKGTVVDSTGTPIEGAILVASGKENSGGYSMSTDNGSFFITGLDPAKFKITAVAFGYEPVTLTDIPVPTSNLSIVLTPSLTKTAGLIRYRLGRGDGMSDVERMYSELVPAAYPNCTKGNCPDGYWGGVSMEITGMLKLPGLALGGSIPTLNIGSYVCFNFHSYFFFNQTCEYIGGAYDAIGSLAGTASGIFVMNACCGEKILEPTTDGAVFSFSPQTPGVVAPIFQIAIDSNNEGVKFITLSGGGAVPALDWRKYFDLPTFSRSGTYRHCSSKEFNIFKVGAK